uniref:Uncharacterized protein n=1 Tax=Lactuca sativa TaxID=4236 RepID=A0A9R1XI66_LACSA|nr:hypothetical protein LSAT_V11C400207290 [Lactuca sativa]
MSDFVDVRINRFWEDPFRGEVRHFAEHPPRNDVSLHRMRMHIAHGDPLLVHLMMLHEVRSQQVFEIARFLFEIEGMQLHCGETKYILICGLKVGPYVDLLHDQKGRSNSNLCARFFLDISDARLQLKDLEDYFMSPNYLSL